MTISATIAVGAVASILFIWIGYPLAIGLVSLVVRRPLQPDYVRSRHRRVSLVIATRDTQSAIAARVANALDTEHPAELLEVIVAVDSGAPLQGSPAFDNRDARVRVVAGDEPEGKAGALNAGVRAATGDVLIMADTAQRFDRRTIPELVACLEDERFGAVSGALTLADVGSRFSPMHLYWAGEKWLRYHEAIIHSSIGVTGAVYATRRSSWPVVPSGTLLDDVYVPMALVLAGHRVGFTPAAVATDERVFNAEAESVRKERTLTGVLQLLRLLPKVVSVRNPIVVQFVLHKLARLATPVLLVIAMAAGLQPAAQTAMRFPVAVATVVGLVLTLVLIVAPLRQRVGTTLSWMLSLQLATFRAVANGFHGRWGVWKRH